MLWLFEEYSDGCIEVLAGPYEKLESVIDLIEDGLYGKAQAIYDEYGTIHYAKFLREE